MLSKQSEMFAIIPQIGVDMDIAACQIREHVRELCGTVGVTSDVGIATVMRLRIPRYVSAME